MGEQEVNQYIIQKFLEWLLKSTLVATITKLFVDYLERRLTRSPDSDSGRMTAIANGIKIVCIGCEKFVGWEPLANDYAEVILSSNRQVEEDIRNKKNKSKKSSTEVR